MQVSRFAHMIGRSTILTAGPEADFAEAFIEERNNNIRLPYSTGYLDFPIVLWDEVQCSRPQNDMGQ